MLNVLSKGNSVIGAILDVLLPSVCFVCGQSASSRYGLCDACLSRMQFIPPPYCFKCGRHNIARGGLCGECGVKESPVVRGWACCYYENVVKECVHLFKYKGVLGLGEIFGDLMVDFAKRNQIDKNADVIVPVPMHKAKKRERTYNHAEILALTLSKRLKIPLDTRNLRKIKWSDPQNELEKEMRLINVRGTLKVFDEKAFSGKRVLLVDDVYTTGSTINECGRVLLESSADKVFFLTLARGV